jgi:hypothetical protein
VDNFAIATANPNTADNTIAQINTPLRMRMKNMGVISRYNGVDIQQIHHYIKIHCAKYLNKMLQHKDWIPDDTPTNLPLLFPSNKQYLKQLQECPIPNMHTEKLKLEQWMGFKYHQVMGKIMFLMVKCRPDISSHAIILSQYMGNPGAAHYHALKEISIYLGATRDHAIYYWRGKYGPPTCQYTPH